MRRLAPIVLVVLVIVAACGSTEKPEASRAFCLAADKYNTELERAKKETRADLDRQLPFVEEIARTAPRQIRADAATFVDALRRLPDDPSVKTDPAVRDAVDNVNRFANQACNVYQSDGGI